MAVWFFTLFFKRALIERLQAKWTHKVFWMILFVESCNTTASNWLRTWCTDGATVSIEMTFAVHRTIQFVESTFIKGQMALLQQQIECRLSNLWQINVLIIINIIHKVYLHRISTIMQRVPEETITPKQMHTISASDGTKLPIWHSPVKRFITMSPSTSAMELNCRSDTHQYSVSSKFTM